MTLEKEQQPLSKRCVEGPRVNLFLSFRCTWTVRCFISAWMETDRQTWVLGFCCQTPFGFHGIGGRVGSKEGASRERLLGLSVFDFPSQCIELTAVCAYSAYVPFMRTRWAMWKPFHPLLRVQCKVLLETWFLLHWQTKQLDAALCEPVGMCSNLGPAAC